MSDTTTLSRRTVFDGPVTEAQVTALETQAESAVTRVNRVAWELAHAMDDWLAALGDDPGDWKAHVWAASYSEFAVSFEHLTATRELSAPSPKLKAAIEAHRVAHQALNDACEPTDAVAMAAKGKRVTKAAMARRRRADRAEQTALRDLLRFKCPNNASRDMKATYLQKHLARTQAPADAIGLLLGSEMY